MPPGIKGARRFGRCGAPIERVDVQWMIGRLSLRARSGIVVQAASETDGSDLAAAVLRA